MCTYCDELTTKYPGARIRECPVVAQARRQLVTSDVLHQPLPNQAKPHARVFIHPRCLSGPAFGAMQAALDGCGIDSTNTMVGPPSPRGYCELVRMIGPSATLNGGKEYERFDGSRFHYADNTATGRVA